MVKKKENKRAFEQYVTGTTTYKKNLTNYFLDSLLIEKNAK